MHRGWLLSLAACSGAHATAPPAKTVVIDRFSAQAGHLMVRSERNHLPAPGAPIDFDRPPFITQGLGPDGAVVRYYNFDVQSEVPAPRYRLVRDGRPIAGELDLVDAIPGDAGYSDFWQLATVEVPASISPATLRSVADVRAARLAIRPGSTVIDCPIVPRGSTAREGGAAVVEEVRYRGERLTCLRFGAPLLLDGDGRVPTSPIYVTFARETEFAREGATPQTHNVVLSLPGDTDYSPLWAVKIYAVSAFAGVRDAETARAAPYVKDGPLVNCPIVSTGAK